MVKKVLVIDDDVELGILIEMVLKTDELSIHHAHSGLDGLKQAYQIQPDLIILDIMMPGLDGFTVGTRLREMMDIPILMLTAYANEKEIVRSFTIGMDDFLRKPFNNNELRVRVQALLRRSDNQNSRAASHITTYKDPVLEINFSSQIVNLLGKAIELSPKEYGLLTCLVRKEGKVVSHHGLLQEVWGNSYVDATSIASLYIYYLRKKLQDGKHGHQYIRTSWGRGYWFAPRREENL